ncbi:MAG: hypothetical protein QOF08_3030 [Gaiellales bacterium]|nr:hypothetical protein [Gaiellales bacterium]
MFTGVAMTTSRLLLLDTYTNLSTGRLIAQHGLPRIETLTWAAHGKPWIDQQWLGQWLFYEAYRAGGYPAVGALSAASIALAFGLLAGYMMHRGVSPVRTLIWTVIAYGVCELNTIVRTQSFAYPLFVLTLIVILDDDRERRFGRRLLILPLVFLLWANLHGSVMLAAPIVVAYCLWAAAHNRRAAMRRTMAAYLMLAVCMPLALVITPYGLTIIDYYRSVLGNPVLAERVSEWQPATFTGASTQFVIVLLATVAAIGFAYGRHYRPPLFMVAVTCALAAAGVHAVRYQIWFAFAATILVADVMHATSPGGDSALLRRVTAKLIPALAVVGVIGASAVLATTPQSRFEQLAPPAPLDATAAYAASHPAAKIMAVDVSASALLWRHPELNGRVGFDARYEIYSQSDLEAYTDWVAGQGVRARWSRVLRGYDVAVASTLLRQNVINRMRALPGWHQIFSDADGAVFVRNSAG